jgi:hypothetical protein
MHITRCKKLEQIEHLAERAGFEFADWTLVSVGGRSPKVVFDSDPYLAYKFTLPIRLL